MKKRSVNRIIPAQKVNMGGIYLDQSLPASGIDQIDPFLLIHHWDKTLKGGSRQQDEGVGPHPHRGFSPVTIIFKGGIHHQDSRGNNSVVMEGGTQWMNSGMGIIHSERPAKELAENGGELEFIQFWVNTPAANKMDEPSYQPLTKENTPAYSSADNKVKIQIVVGELNSIKGPVESNSPLLVLRLDIIRKGQINLAVPKEYNAMIYQLDGSLYVSETRKKTKAKDLIWFNNDADHIFVEANKDTRAILLAGMPINEKITTHGPFVMNTQTEIMEALRDYQMGKMGVLIEEFK